MNFNRENVISMLNLLGIDYDASKISTNGWISCLCPMHSDRHYGNAAVNINSGVISCFSCGQKVSLLKLAKQRNLLNIENYIPKDFVSSIPHQVKREIINYNYDFSYIPLDPDKHSYTKSRGYTKGFCEEFQVVHCISGDYENYFTIPIIDSKRKVKTYEARKLCKDVYLKKYYKNKKTRLSYENLFDQECEEKDYKIIKGKIFDKAGNQYFSYDLLYLLKPKVLYPFLSGVWCTIFNVDNLDFNQDLWLSEGTGTIPKVYQYISKNCSATFGSKITKEQFEILRRFKKKIIVIVDLDIAGYQMVLSMFEKLNNILICVVDSKDTDDSFIKDIQSTSLIEANEFLIKYKF